MSEFGNETTTATMRAGEKTIDSLLKLLKFIMESNDRKINRELNKEKYNQLKNAREKEQIREYLDRKRGHVRASMLFKSGERLIPLTIPLSPKELARFNQLARIEGVTFTAIANRKIIEELRLVKKELAEITEIGSKEGLTKEQFARKNQLIEKLESLEKTREDRIVIVRSKDLELVKDITDRMNMEINFSDIEEELTQLMNKGEENLTDEEKERVTELLEEKESLLKNEFNTFNGNNNESILQGALGNKVSYEILGFEKAINRVTDNEYRTKPCYICERTNPVNYIEVTSQPEEYQGRTFTNTEFKVFNNGVKQTCDEFSHGRFSHYSKRDGENSSSYGDEHWENMKTEMKEKGGFTDDTIIFRSFEDYEKYKNEFIKLKEETVTENSVIPSVTEDAEINYVDYGSMIKQLKNQLKSELNENKIIVNGKCEIFSTETGEEIITLEEHAASKKLSYAEAINISKQITVLQEMNNLQTQLADINNHLEIMGQKDVPTAFKGAHFTAIETLETQAKEINEEINTLNIKYKHLEMEREQLQSVKVMGELQEETQQKNLSDVNDILDNDKSNDTDTHASSNKAEWKSKVDTKMSKKSLSADTSTVKESIKLSERELE